VLERIGEEEWKERVFNERDGKGIDRRGSRDGGRWDRMGDIEGLLSCFMLNRGYLGAALDTPKRNPALIISPKSPSSRRFVVVEEKTVEKVRTSVQSTPSDTHHVSRLRGIPPTEIVSLLYIIGFEIQLSLFFVKLYKVHLL
jgi:hypothetical protein